MARERFAAASARAGVTAKPLTLSASMVSAGHQFGQIARRFDLAVVGQAEPETNSVDGSIVEAALFDSGRPVISVPFIQRAPLKLDRVMVCWDSSRAAARAIGDAMPLLQRAGRAKHLNIERLFRDAHAGAVMAPTGDVLRELIARATLGMPLF